MRVEKKKYKNSISGVAAGDYIEGSIFKVKNKYRAEILLGDKSITKQAPTYDLAIEKLLELNKKTNNNDHIFEKTVFFSDLIDRYFEYRKIMHKNIIDENSLKNRIKNMSSIREEFSMLRVSKLNEINISEIHDFIANEKTNDKYHAQGTLDRKFQLLYKAFEFAHENKLIDKATYDIILKTKKLTKYIKSKKEKKEFTYYSPEDMIFIQDMLEEREYSNVSLVAMLQYHQGMRVSEVLGLPFKNIDLLNGIIKVRQVATKHGIKSVPKSDAGNRDLIIAEFLKPVIKNYINNNMDIFEPDKLVFPRKKMLKTISRSNTQKEYFSSEEIGSIFRRVFKDVELPKRKDGTKAKTNSIESHNFRRSFGTNAANNGVPPQVLCSVMGHTDFNMTYQHYYLDNEENTRAAMNEFYEKMFKKIS
tara:strand:+ start:1862 stop:3118 length:1257 start_codon:yes stop_codon:yes gene_type:complete